MTKYLVMVRPAELEGLEELEGKVDGKVWIEYDRVEASSQDAAVRNAIKPGCPNGLYVAIPLRSFQPLDVEVQAKPAVAIGKPVES